MTNNEEGECAVTDLLTGQRSGTKGYSESERPRL